MLTGSGVALILRVVGTPPDDPWNTYAWEIVRDHRRPVAAVEVRHQVPRHARLQPVEHRVGRRVRGARRTTRIEPLDFWWAPLNAWMITAYAVIIGGGLLITRRLKLLGLAATFWLVLAAGSVCSPRPATA